MPRHKREFAGEKRSAYVGIFMTPTAKAALEMAAMGQRQSVSSFAAGLLETRTAEAMAAAAEVSQRHPDIRPLIEELSRLGNNLNQIAHQLNASGQLTPDREELLLDLGVLLKAALARIIAL